MLLKMNNPKHIWKTRIFWELTGINLVVIAIVIVIAGFSVKEFACYLADDMNMTGSLKQSDFNETMDYYLIRVSLIAFMIAVIIHFIWIRRIITPIQSLSDVTKQISEGGEMQIVPVKVNNEVGQLTINFNRLIGKLKRSEQLRNKMTTDLAHEVRTPLSNITGYLEALKNGVIKPDRELMASLHDEAERLKKLIEQLYHLSEEEWKNEVTENLEKPLNITLIIEKMLAMHAIELEKKQIPYETAIEEAYLAVPQDIIKQIVGNIIDNAIRYAVDETALIIKGKTLDTYYLLQVSGHGQAIPVDSRVSLFERFYRVDQSRSRQSGGNGLGLAIVKELVERYEGSVWLETDGTYHTFMIKMPLLNREGQ